MAGFNAFQYPPLTGQKRTSLETDFLPFGTKGLNLIIPEINMDQDYLALADNTSYDFAGIVRKRPGTMRWTPNAASAGSVRSGYEFWFNSAGTFYVRLLVGCNGRVSWNNAGTWIDVTPFDTYLSSETIFYFVQLANKVLILNDQNSAPWYWDGLTAKASILSGTGVLNWSAATQYAGRILAFGDPNYPDYVSVSANGDLTAWGEADAGILIFTPGDGDRIIGISPELYDRVIVFKGPNKGSIQQLLGSTFGTGTGTDFYRQPMIRGIRCLGQRCIIPYGNSVIFMSDRGLHELAMTANFGQVEHNFLSFPIQPWMPSINWILAKRFSLAFAPKASTILASVATGSDIDTTLCYNVIKQQWSRWPQTTYYSLIESHNVALGGMDVLAGQALGKVVTLFQEARNDDGSAYTWQIQSGRLLLPQNLKAAGEQAHYLEVLLFLQQSTGATLNISYQVDNLTPESFSLVVPAGIDSGILGSTFILGKTTLGGPGPGKGLVTLRKVLVNAPQGQTIQFTISNSGLNEDVALYGLGLRTTPAGEVTGKTT